MNAQNATDKTINIIDFTICGVGGFKTVCAAGGSTTKRMFSALNDMHRKFKDEDKKLSGSEEAATISEEHRKVRYAFQLITTIKDRFMHYGDSAQFIPNNDLNDATSITTAQFLTETNWIYEQNIATFLNKLSEIDTAIYKHIEKAYQEVSANKKRHVADVAPILCVCSGGIFGEKPFYIFMPQLSILELGRGDPSQAAQFLVSRAIVSVKNFKLSDYLRLIGEPKETVKQDLLFLDEQIDRLGEIKAEMVPDSVFSKSLTANCRNKSAYEKILDAGITLMQESESRLLDYVINAQGSAKIAVDG